MTPALPVPDEMRPARVWIGCVMVWTIVAFEALAPDQEIFMTAASGLPPKIKEHFGSTVPGPCRQRGVLHLPIPPGRP